MPLDHHNTNSDIKQCGDWQYVFSRSKILFTRAWPAMAAYVFPIWAAEFSILLPLSLWILARLVVRSGEVVVGNSALLDWLFSTEGILYVLTAGSLGFLGLVLPATGLFWIAAAQDQGSVLTARETLGRVLLALPRLLYFCLATCLLLVLCLLPLLAGVGVLALLLRPQGFYYHRTMGSPEWRWALIIGGGWLGSWTCVITGLLLRWSYALPLWLDGVRPLGRAFRRSWAATRGASWRLLRLIGTCVGAAILVQIVLEIVIYLAAGLALSRLSDSVLGLLYTVSAYAILTSFAAAFSVFLGLALGSCILLVCYQRQAGSQVSRDATLAPGRLPNVNVNTGRGLRPRTVLTIIVVFLGASSAVSLSLLDHDVVGYRPLIIAHRAKAGPAPENTLTALEEAIQHDADWAEIDVQRSADGVIIAAHDADLLRVAGSPLRIRETTYATLAKIDIGKQFGDRFAGEKLRTLSDFLERARGRIKLLIELKHYGDDPQLADDTVSLVRQHGMTGEVAIMSFRLDSVRQVQRLAPDIRVGYVAHTDVGDLANLDVDFLAIAQHRAKSRLLRQTQRRGLPAYAWTVNEADDMLDLIEQGIDGLITDDPGLASETLRHIRALAPPERALLRFRHLWGPYRAEHASGE